MLCEVDAQVHPGFGARRLSIIDVRRGRLQRLVNRDYSVWALLNGGMCDSQRDGDDDAMTPRSERAVIHARASRGIKLMLSRQVAILVFTFLTGIVLARLLVLRSSARTLSLFSWWTYLPCSATSAWPPRSCNARTI